MKAALYLAFALFASQALSSASHAMERWYQTPTGPRIKSNCFVDEPTSAQLRSLDASMAETAARMHACKQNYPELTPYIQRWLEDFREVKIRCYESNYGGKRVLGTTVINEQIFPYLTQNPANLTLRARNQRDRAIDTLIHEGLHGVDVDNQSVSRHNHDENLPSDFIPLEVGESCFTHPLSCETSTVVSDRVAMISNLCSENAIPISYNVRAEYALFQQMLHCGVKQGCAKVFSEGRQPRLSPPAAELLCKRIFEAGHCRRQTGTQLLPGVHFKLRPFHLRPFHELTSAPRCTRQWTGESVEQILESYRRACSQPGVENWTPEALF